MNLFMSAGLFFALVLTGFSQTVGSKSKTGNTVLAVTKRGVNQGVAVDADYYYTINNRSVTKCRRKDETKVVRESPGTGPMNDPFCGESESPKDIASHQPSYPALERSDMTFNINGRSQCHV